MKRRIFIQNTGATALGGILIPTLVPSAVSDNNTLSKLQGETTKNRDDFVIEALTDFPDEALSASEPIGEAHIEAMMRRLAECGIRRVSWAYYADGCGGFLTPANDPGFANLAQTYQGLGQNPLSVAVEAAHRHGLDIYAYFKPYETGPAILFPEGSYEAALYGRLSQIGGRMTWMNPFVVDHPNLRIKRRVDDLVPDIQQAPIHSIKLRKADASPTRIKVENLQIWVSDFNCRYRRLDMPLTLTESIEPSPRDVIDLFSEEILVHRGDPQRVLTLSGLNLRNQYVLITTDFTDDKADFTNTDLEMLEAFDAKGQKILGVIASGTAIWNRERVDFRQWGLMFDTGYNGQKIYLDETNANGKKGIVAFTRGRNEYLPGALCETEPQVQEFWLRCIEGILDTGVDGIDFREENHSTHTNHPEDYGFNEVVLAKCRERGKIDLPMIAAVRGDAYTEFLRRAKQLINGRGKKMRINFQIDWYRPDPPRRRRLGYPANTDFQWQRWIEEGLTDEAVLRFYALPFNCVFDDEIAQDMIVRCRKKNIPVTVNRYINTDTLTEEFLRVREDGRFSGFILYETYRFLKFKPGGECEVSVPEVMSLQKLKS